MKHGKSFYNKARPAHLQNWWEGLMLFRKEDTEDPIHVMCCYLVMSHVPKLGGIWMEKPEGEKAQGIFLCVPLHVELRYGS